MKLPTAERRRSSRLRQGLGDLPRAFVSNRSETGEPEIDPVAEAFERGREQGAEQAQRQAAEQLEKQVRELQQRIGESLRHLSEVEQELNRRHTGLMIELALEAAAKILRTRIEADDPVAARALAAAAEALPSGETLHARLNPEDLEPVKRELAQEISKRRIELVSDPGVSRGGCIVDGDCGTIDATVETAVAAVRSAAEGRAGTT